MNKKIATSQAPKAVGPYSQAVSSNGFLFVSGQIPLNPETGQLVDGDIEAQARQVFHNIDAILKEAGLDFSHVVSATVYLAAISDFTAVNRIYAEYFTGEVLPARSAVQVGALPKGAQLEISCIAAKAD